MTTTCCACFAKMTVCGSNGFIVSLVLSGLPLESQVRRTVNGQNRRRFTRPTAHDYWTMTLAVIFGWREQKYVYVPGFTKVKLNFSSVSSARDLKVALSSLTTVCGISS